MNEYEQLASNEVISKTQQSLENKGYKVFVLDTSQQALEKIKELIPAGSSVMNGASTTLDQIGYMAYLESGKHSWNDLHAKINSENDKEKRDKLRRESVLSEYYLGSVHALAQTGEFVIASNTASQLPLVVYTSQNLIFVVSSKKIVATLDAAMRRLKDHVIPKEDERSMKAYNAHTADNKVVIFNGESPMSKRTITFLLVSQDLGF